MLEPTDDPRRIADRLPGLKLVAVNFPKYGDGRGYSIARLLREGPAATPFIDLPGGVFEMGSLGRPDEQPLRLVRVRPFSVALLPVTNVEFAAFLEATGHEPPGYWDDPRFRRPDCPVIGVSWFDAVDYCAWLSTILGRLCRLPHVNDDLADGN